MYEIPGLGPATDAWWQGLARHFRATGIADVPEAPTRPDDLYAHWTDPALLFSQACGYPLTHALAGKCQLVATPCYAASGCAGPTYRSLLIVAENAPLRTLEDLRGRTVCYNGEDSQSGYNILRATFAPLARDGRFFGRAVCSGAHIDSIAMVARAEADIASIDCVTHALLARHAPERLAGTRILAETASAPGLPYITSAMTGAETLARLRAGLSAALADPALAAARAALLIAGAEVLPLGAYGTIPSMQGAAVASGYPVLA